MALLKILVGGAVLLFGRRLFWLFVGVVGFVVGMEVATRVYWGAPSPNILIIGLAAGIIGAVLALALQELMIGVVGFVAGAYLGGQLVMTLMAYPGQYIWVGLLVGGIVGALFLNAIFHWALIVLSSLFGASFIVQALPVAPEAARIAFFVLAAVGIASQASLLRRRPRRVRI